MPAHFQEVAQAQQLQYRDRGQHGQGNNERERAKHPLHNPRRAHPHQTQQVDRACRARRRSHPPLEFDQPVPNRKPWAHSPTQYSPPRRSSWFMIIDTKWAWVATFDALLRSLPVLRCQIGPLSNGPAGDNRDRPNLRLGLRMAGGVASLGSTSAQHLPPPDDTIRIRGARVHNLQNVDLDHPPRPAGRDHRPQRLGQELAGLRHAVRRGAAAVHRKPVGLRPAVPAPDGTARRRSDRGAAADDLHRPAGRQPEPAQHGGHGHRDLRLPAAAVRPAGRAGLLPSAASRSASRRPSRSSTTCWRCPRAPR